MLITVDVIVTNCTDKKECDVENYRFYMELLHFNFEIICNEYSQLHVRFFDDTHVKCTCYLRHSIIQQDNIINYFLLLLHITIQV